jgi:hypothetical protein
MAIKISELKLWLETLDDGNLVWVEEEGLTLKSTGKDYEAYIEVGGETNDY